MGPRCKNNRINGIILQNRFIQLRACFDLWRSLKVTNSNPIESPFTTFYQWLNVYLNRFRNIAPQNHKVAVYSLSSDPILYFYPSARRHILNFVVKITKNKLIYWSYFTVKTAWNCGSVQCFRRILMYFFIFCMCMCFYACFSFFFMVYGSLWTDSINGWMNEWIYHYCMLETDDKQHIMATARLLRCNSRTTVAFIESAM